MGVRLLTLWSAFPPLGFANPGRRGCQPGVAGCYLSAEHPLHPSLPSLLSQSLEVATATGDDYQGARGAQLGPSRFRRDAVSQIQGGCRKLVRPDLGWAGQSGGAVCMGGRRGPSGWHRLTTSLHQPRCLPRVERNRDFNPSLQPWICRSRHEVGKSDSSAKSRQVEQKVERHRPQLGRSTEIDADSGQTCPGAKRSLSGFGPMWFKVGKSQGSSAEVELSFKISARTWSHLRRRRPKLDGV